MKRILFISALAFLAVACTGTVDPTDDGAEEIPAEFTAPFTLSADKAEVEADGVDCVTFILSDAYGRNVLTDMKALENVNIVSDEGVRVPRMETSVSYLSNGTFNYTASYKGKKSNTIQVVAKNRAAYERYHKNVAIYKATATWCGPCAVMTRALLGMSNDTKEHSVELCWHYLDEHAFVYPGYTYDCGEEIFTYFNGTGVPTVALDLKTVILDRTSSALDKAIWKLRADYPATCGIKVSTKVDASSNVADITAELTTSTGGKYDLGMVLLLNNQIIATGTNDGGKYSHIVKATTGNFLRHSSATVKELEKDGKMMLTQQLSLPSYSVEDLSVAVFAIIPDGNASRIDNIVEVKLGESVDYNLND